jgi:hypothetical protein
MYNYFRRVQYRHQYFIYGRVRFIVAIKTQAVYIIHYSTDWRKLATHLSDQINPDVA